MKQNLAVIVLNYNDATSTIKYVNTIEKYKCIDKIVVIDNLSPDGSYEKLKSLTSKKIDVIVSDGNKGYAYGNNFAIRYLNKEYGEFKYIAISNPDVEVSEESYNKCLEFLDKHNKVAITAPRMYDINDNPHPLSGWKIRSLKGDVRDSSLLLTEIYQKPHIECYPKEYLNKKVCYVDCVAGSFFIIRHSIFKELDYFDENTFLYFEEDILGNKIKQAGYKNVVLNTCKFNHYESVTVDKNMSFMKKYKNLQKSKKYYHKNYNERCNTKTTGWKILVLDFVTWFRNIEEKSAPIVTKLKLDKLFRFIRAIHIREIPLKLVKLLLLIINIILLPITWLLKLLRKRKKVLYFSLVTWKWIKQRPHFVALELVKEGNYNVDYRYQTLYDKYMPNQDNLHVKNKIEKLNNFHIKSFKILPATTKFRTNINSVWSIIRTSFWNYDKVILTHPNQTDFFFMGLFKIKGTKIYYECMDNYEGWELDSYGYRYKQNRLIQHSEHIIVTAKKLKNKIISQHNCENKITIVRNGYDKNLFENYKKIKTTLKHPNITYIGTIDDWFDFKSVIEFAINNKDFNINIIGPINDNVKNITDNIKNKNIKFHGPIEHNSVPQYIKDSDVLMMPFIVNDIIEYVDPVKLYEYLYMKKSVVTTYWNELEQFKDMVYFYKGPKDFEKKVKKAINNKLIETNEYKELMANSNWNERLKEYLDAIK